MLEKVKSVEQQTTKYQTGDAGRRATDGHTGLESCPSDAEKQEVMESRGD